MIRSPDVSATRKSTKKTSAGRADLTLPSGQARLAAPSRVAAAGGAALAAPQSGAAGGARRPAGGDAPRPARRPAAIPAAGPRAGRPDRGERHADRLEGLEPRLSWRSVLNTDVRERYTDSELSCKDFLVVSVNDTFEITCRADMVARWKKWKILLIRGEGLANSIYSQCTTLSASMTCRRSCIPSPPPPSVSAVTA